MIGPLLRMEIESTFQVMREKSTDEEIVFCCVDCGEKSGHRSVNLKTGLTFCWKCGKGRNNKGNFLAWARALGYTFTAGAGAPTVSVSELLARDLRADHSKLPVLKEVALPRGFTPLAREPQSAYTRLITRMARRKHLDYADFAAAGAGFTRTDPRWEPYCIFPVREYGIPVYYQGRTYVDVPGQSTKRFPSRRDVPFGASYWVYNLDAVRSAQPSTVVLVESILNVLSLQRKFAELGETDFVPVSVFKHHVSKVQAIKLLQCAGVKEFCLLFDRDAIDETWRVVGSLGMRLRLTIAEMPHRPDNLKLDANDDVEAACDAIAGRQRYDGPSAMRHRLNLTPQDRKYALSGRQGDRRFGS